MNTDIIKKYNMLPPGTRVLCAVSGGADSMCLLHFLASSAMKMGIEICAAHFDHQLRGLESARDRTFVKEWCGEQGIECRIGFGEVKKYAAENGMGIEEAARTLRYGFLEKTADELGCGKIATAHNADDNAETMLLNLTRGTGLAGLSGIPPVRGRIIRPLLGVTRSEILDYLKDNGIPHVEDSSNASDDYARNIIRHNVMPVLRSLNPSISENALRAGVLVREDEEYLSSLADKFIIEHVKDKSADICRLKALPVPASSRVIRKMSDRTLNREHVDAVRKLLEGDGRAFADVPGMRVTREQGRLYFGQRETHPIRNTALTIGGVTEIPDTGIRIAAEILEAGTEINNSLNTFYFKYENICGKILCTRRADGDKVRLSRRGCTKSLKALFAEKGMTQQQRDTTPVLRDDNGIIAVYGFGVAESMTALPGDKVLRVKIEKTETNDNA